jgi:ABC-type glycerol-3-phosphate transport system substrate-binding protein
MRATIKLMSTDAGFDTIIITNNILAKGVRKALSLTLPPGGKRPELVIFCDPQWTNIDGDFEEYVKLPFGKIGEKALLALVENIRDDRNEPREFMIDNTAKQAEKGTVHIDQYRGSRSGIRVLLQDGQMGYAVKSLTNDFIRRTGIDVIIDMMPYRHILSAIKAIKQNKGERYDAFCTDVPWMKELVLGGHIECLESFISPEERQVYFDVFQRNIFTEYSMYENAIYALPYSYTVQMHYYRKDLFERVKNKRLYHDMYKEDLKVPANWKEYNKVARFFTRRFNPDSETLYGTTLGGKVYSGAVCEYLPRMWSFGSSVFNGDRVTINTPRAVEALENYVECFDYAPPGAQDWWWDDEAREFCRGTTAMMVLFSDHCTVLRDRNMSTVAGKTGHRASPGGISMLGGWNIAVSAASENKRAAYEFLKWTVCEEMLMPNAVLGRVVPYKSISDNTELANFYPWHKDSFRMFSNVGKRILPEISGREIISEDLFERIVSEGVYGAITKAVSSGDAIAQIERRLTELIRQ